MWNFRSGIFQYKKINWFSHAKNFHLFLWFLDFLKSVNSHYKTFFVWLDYNPLSLALCIKRFFVIRFILGWFCFPFFLFTILRCSLLFSHVLFAFTTHIDIRKADYMWKACGKKLRLECEGINSKIHKFNEIMNDELTLLPVMLLRYWNVIRGFLLINLLLVD